jgi:hypothetical protein
VLDDPLSLALAVTAAFLVGVTKTGLPGIGSLTAVLMAAAVPGKYSVGLLCTVLLTGDFFALRYYRHHGQVRVIFKLIPAMAVGIAAGAYVLHSLDDDMFRPALALVVVGLLALELLRRRGNAESFQGHPVIAVIVGFGAGFATTVANAAGAIMSVYLIMLGLQKREFIGTITWYYFIFNALKIPVFMYIGVLPVEHLRYTIWLALPVALGAIVGAIIFRITPQKLFDAIVLGTTAMGAAWLLISSFR